MAHRQVLPINRVAMREAGVAVQWKRRSGSVVIANEEWGIFVHHIMWATESGRPLYDRAVIAHRGGAMILPLDKKGRVGLIRKWQAQSADPEKYWSVFPNIKIEGLGRESYEIPGGMAEPGETLESAARRELREEASLVTAKLHSLGFLGNDPPSIVHMDHYFWCQARAAKTQRNVDEVEGITSTARFYSRKQIRKLILQGKLYDTRTLAALSAYWMMRPKKFH